MRTDTTEQDPDLNLKLTATPEMGGKLPLDNLSLSLKSAHSRQLLSNCRLVGRKMPGSLSLTSI